MAAATKMTNRLRLAPLLLAPPPPLPLLLSFLLLASCSLLVVVLACMQKERPTMNITKNMIKEGESKGNSPAGVGHLRCISLVALLFSLPQHMQQGTRPHPHRRPRLRKNSCVGQRWLMIMGEFICLPISWMISCALLASQNAPCCM